MISSKAFSAKFCDFRNIFLFIYLFSQKHSLQKVCDFRNIFLFIYLFIYLFSQKHSLQKCVILEICSYLFIY